MRENTHSDLRVRVWCFIARETDLTVGVQTTARTPSVSFFSGDSIGGRERRNRGSLDVRLTETQKDA